MKKPELVAGIKNAIERGEGLGKAKQSFISAGYNQQDVEDSAKDLDGVISRIPKETPEQKTPVAEEKQTKSRKLKFRIILLVILLIIVLAALGASFFFKDQIIGFFSSLFG